MSGRDISYYLADDYDYDLEQSSSEGRLHERRDRRTRRGEYAMLEELLSHSDEAADAQALEFNPTLRSSRHERIWILNYLGAFYDRRMITDVLYRAKGGKEANVYCCTASQALGTRLVAAKLYRPRMFRNLRNDAAYRQGRQILDAHGKPVRDARYLRAVQRGTHVGKELQHGSWLEHEFQTMVLLYEAGVSVPQPLERGNNTILMEYVGDERRPAPALHEVRLEPREAVRLYELLMADVETMLRRGRIHADLSAYNVLYWEGRPMIIDFPQAIDPETNPRAREIFQRDVTRLCQYFARYGVATDPVQVGEELWAQYGPPPAEIIPEADVEDDD
jgi:RIO kinase 1